MPGDYQRAILQGNGELDHLATTSEDFATAVTTAETGVDVDGPMRDWALALRRIGAEGAPRRGRHARAPSLPTSRVAPLSFRAIASAARHLATCAFAASAFAASSGCGASHSATPAPSAAAKRAEIAQERKAASYAPPPHAVVAAAGPTPAARDPNARAALIRAARDLLAYHRRHGTYAVGPVASLHRLDPATRLVDFVDARQGSFFLAVDPPTSTRIWRFDYDHDVVSRVACDAPGDRCPGLHRW